MLMTDTSVVLIRPFEDKDLTLIGRCVYGNVWTELPDEVKPYSWTAEVCGDVIAIGGISIYWKGVGEAWLFVNEQKGYLFGFQLVRQIRRKMLDLMREHRLVRVQATVDKTFYKGIRLLKALGFQPEGVLRRYLYGERDAFIMAFIADSVND